MTDDYEDLRKMIEELKEMHKALLPPMKIERGYEIVGILQDMALEEESEASAEVPEYTTVAEGITINKPATVIEEPVEAEPDYSMTEEEQMADVANQIIDIVTTPIKERKAKKALEDETEAKK